MPIESDRKILGLHVRDPPVVETGPRGLCRVRAVARLDGRKTQNNQRECRLTFSTYANENNLWKSGADSLSEEGSIISACPFAFMVILLTTLPGWSV